MTRYEKSKLDINVDRIDKLRKLYRLHGNMCKVCAYDKCSAALDFHHIDPTTKKFNVKTGLSRSLESLVEEAKKGILLCANCHREHHYYEKHPKMKGRKLKLVS